MSSSYSFFQFKEIIKLSELANIKSPFLTKQSLYLSFLKDLIKVF